MPGYKTVTAVLCGLLVCAELTGGYVGGGFDALRRLASSDKDSGPKERGPRKPRRGDGGGTTTPIYPEETVIPSNFDIQAELISAALAPSSTDSYGVFRINCGAGPILRDDPVAHPNQPGASHLQQFFGNRSATAYSTYASLRSGGGSTCMSPVDRSLYTIPAMLDGGGNMVRPDYVSLAFKSRPASDASCQPSSGTGGCIPFPNGLRIAFGYDPSVSTAGGGNPRFSCGGSTVSAEYDSLMEAAAGCPNPGSGGARLVASLDAPSCWDGKNLDSSDHRSHMAYPEEGLFSGAKCPSTHPFQIPALSMSVRYTADENVSNWRFSTDETVQGAKPGTTFRATWFGAWDNQIEGMWMQNCVNKKLNCSNGNVGNGKAIRAGSGYVTTASPRLVPLPGASSPKVLASEGDSISVTWGGNHTGMYAKAHPDMKHCGLAVGGSGLSTMLGRIDGVTACNPKVVTVLIGANGLKDATSTDSWTSSLFGYTDTLRAKGYKVAVATILPQYHSTNPTYDTIFNGRRAIVNNAIRGAVGAHIDAVIDFAADPVMGPDVAARNTALYRDGTHPTDGCGPGCGGQGKLFVIYAPVVDRLIGQ
jgi:hypothetical protein